MFTCTSCLFSDLCYFGIAVKRYKLALPGNTVEVLDKLVPLPVPDKPVDNIPETFPGVFVRIEYLLDLRRYHNLLGQLGTFVYDIGHISPFTFLWAKYTFYPFWYIKT
jgi:hypothetical protein